MGNNSERNRIIREQVPGGARLIDTLQWLVELRHRIERPASDGEPGIDNLRSVVRRAVAELAAIKHEMISYLEDREHGE